jgi:plastocyanin
MGMLIALLALATSAAAPGSVSGKVVATEGGALPEMIVCLEPVDPAQSVPPAPSAPVVVSQKGAKFGPPLVIISVGQSVEFRNDEDTPIEHNVFSRSPAKPFDLGLYPPGVQGKLVTFDKPGVVRLYCSIHRYMDGVVYVCPTPLFARVQNGEFSIAHVPAGQWKLRTWQRNPRFNEQEMRITVEPDKATPANLEMKR